ncbi:MAG: hypothetical protein WD874_01250 [Parcubacteria group bacterium]
MKEGKTKAQPQVVEVIPIAKGIPQQSLTYFSEERLSPGNIIKIPLRGGKAFGLVHKVYSAKAAKGSLKSSTFSLKKLSRLGKIVSLPTAFMEAVVRTSKFYVIPVGEILRTVLPKIFLENLELVGTTLHTKGVGNRTEPILIQLEKDDRYGRYKGIVREAFARKSSVSFFVPNHEDALKLYEELSMGIEEFTFLFSLALPPKKLLNTLRKAQSMEHPILFITTPSGAAFYREDLKTFIVERENSRGFTTLTSPIFSMKKFIEFLASAAEAELVEGDSVLSLESLLKERNGESRELFPLKWRLATESKTFLVDMKKITDKDGNLVILSPETRNLLETAHRNNERILLFGARKGLSPTTVCGDCGFVLACKNCGAPVVLHERSEERIYICHTCAAQRTTETRCDNCNSWKLRPLGIGIDLVAKEVKRLYPSFPIYIFDKDHAPTRAKAVALRKKILEDKKAVVVGTELALIHLPKVSYTGVISLDSLFAIPDFSINERIFYLISSIREITRKEVVIQTRNMGKEILNWASQGNISDFYRKEIEERRGLLYPPVSIFIKVTTTGNPAVLEKRFDYLNNHFKNFSPEFVRSRTITKGTLALNMIIRMERNAWPEENLVKELALLTPEFLIKVDPESLL